MVLPQRERQGRGKLSIQTLADCEVRKAKRTLAVSRSGAVHFSKPCFLQPFLAQAIESASARAMGGQKGSGKQKGQSGLEEGQEGGKKGSQVGQAKGNDGLGKGKGQGSMEKGGLGKGHKNDSKGQQVEQGKGKGGLEKGQGKDKGGLGKSEKGEGKGKQMGQGKGKGGLEKGQGKDRGGLEKGQKGDSKGQQVEQGKAKGGLEKGQGKEKGGLEKGQLRELHQSRIQQERHYGFDPSLKESRGRSFRWARPERRKADQEVQDRKAQFEASRPRLETKPPEQQQEGSQRYKAWQLLAEQVSCEEEAFLKQEEAWAAAKEERMEQRKELERMQRNMA